MEQVQRPRPTCESSCCTADPGPGAWIVDKQAPGHKVPLLSNTHPDLVLYHFPTTSTAPAQYLRLNVDSCHHAAFFNLAWCVFSLGKS